VKRTQEKKSRNGRKLVLNLLFLKLKDSKLTDKNKTSIAAGTNRTMPTKPLM
jgi:hypothetical protein